MDDTFKRMSRDFKVPYKDSFWKGAETKLDDASLDDAFRTAAMNMVTGPSFEATDSLDDLFMNDAFVETSAAQKVVYDESFFEQFLANEGDLSMDIAFTEAASTTMVDYMPHYWSDADRALRNEGLHYEYSSDYWKEARRLLDRSDRNVFFIKWSAIAAILLMLSFGGMNLTSMGDTTINGTQRNSGDRQATEHLELNIANLNVETVHETLLADKEIVPFINLNVNNALVLNNSDNGDDTSVNANVTGLKNITAANDPEIIDHYLSNSILLWRDLDTINVKNNFSKLNHGEDDPILMSIGSIQSPSICQIGRLRLEPRIKIEKSPPGIIHSVGLLVEGGIGNKWGDFNFMPTLRSGIGVEYILSLGGRLQNFEFGGNFKINHIRQSQLGAEERSDVYDVHGNVTKYWRKLLLKDMIFTNLNVLTNYRIAPNHKFKFGAGIEYLAGVRSNMSYVNDFTNEITTVNNNWGVKEGLKKIDLRFTVGYEYEVSERFSIQLNSNFGILDRTDDNFLGATQRDTEINVMFGLKYSFLKRMK